MLSEEDSTNGSGQGQEVLDLESQPLLLARLTCSYIESDCI